VARAHFLKEGVYGNLAASPRLACAAPPMPSHTQKRTREGKREFCFSGGGNDSRFDVEHEK
jgi:hypothetical protein